MKPRFGKMAMWTAVIVTMAASAVAFLATPAAAQRTATRPQVIMPDGPVRQIIRKNCTSCHGIDDYAFFSLDREGWKKLIQSKHKAGEAPIPDEEFSLLLDWIVSKFGPTTKPFPRTYIAPEITTFFSDPEAKRLLDRACTSCHDLDRMNQMRRTQDGWRVLAVDMRERGAKLSDEELERLVEWLGRVKGTNQDQ
jgi:cytochrome c5